MAKAVVVVSSRDREKAALGVRWAAAAKRNGWVEDVKVLFFGPSEDLLAEGDEAVMTALKDLKDLGVEAIACRRFAEGKGYAGKLEERGVKVGFVGELIAKYMEEGYKVITF